MGPVTITWTDIRHWRGATGEVVAPWEARLIVRLSVMRASIESEDIERQRKRRAK